MIKALLLFDLILLPGVKEEYVDCPLFNFGNSEDHFIVGFNAGPLLVVALSVSVGPSSEGVS